VKKPTRASLTTYAEDHDIELAFLDPAEVFDPAIIGVIVGFGQEPAVLYDEEKVIVAMMKGGMSREDAEEFYEFNTIGAYIGPATPRFLRHDA
jgi:hypothetical protein